MLETTPTTEVTTVKTLKDFATPGYLVTVGVLSMPHAATARGAKSARVRHALKWSVGRELPIQIQLLPTAVSTVANDPTENDALSARERRSP